MIDLLKEFVITYKPFIETLIIGGLGAAVDAIILALTDGKPDGSIFAIVNVGVLAFLSYCTSKGRELVAKDVQAEADKRVAEVQAPSNTNF